MSKVAMLAPITLVLFLAACARNDPVDENAIMPPDGLVGDASATQMGELWAHTTIGPWRPRDVSNAESASSVSAMCWSRRFHELDRPPNIAR